MKKATVFRSHRSALAALFILGNGVIIFPTKRADEYTFLAYLFCTAVTFLLYFCLTAIINRVYGYKTAESTKPYKKALLVILYFLTAALSLYFAVTAFSDFSLFMSELALKGFPKIISFIAFLVLVIFFALRRMEEFLKFGALAFVFTAVVILFFFLASIENYKIDSIFIFDIPDFKALFPQIKEYLLNPTLAFLLFTVFEVLAFEKTEKSVSAWGLGLGFVLLALCILNSVLLFGTRFSATLDYPYASAVSTVTIGRLFTRLDGFSYFVYFASAISRITVCLFLIKALFKKTQRLFTDNSSNNTP